MYFWNINKLKNQLITTGLSKKTAGLYLVAIVTIHIMPGFFLDNESNLWDKIDTVAFIAFLILGCAYCFIVNGGYSGKDFFKRYLSLSWVFGIRYFCMILLPILMVFYAALNLFFPELPEETQWYDTTLYVFLTFPFYLFLAEHIREVSLDRNNGKNKILNWLSSYIPSDKDESFDVTQYPRVVVRYLATTIDVIFILGLFICVSYLFQGQDGTPAMMRLIFFLFVVFVYEPFFTCKLCTLGQKIMKIRVRSIKTKDKISIIQAYIRILIKIVLGIISFFSIPFTKNKRALHDFAAGSVVIYAYSSKSS
jgi:uncharacterized RDD family membrane protein YckC